MSVARRRAHGLFSRAIAALADSYVFNRRLRENLRDLTVGSRRDRLPAITYRPPGRYGLGGAGAGADTGRRPIFVTARFRSGSTFLWNLFRHTEGLTAYYEPLNERRWFEQIADAAGTDESHRGVGDYRREYSGLEGLGALFREDWTFRRLYMDAHSCDRALERYLRGLIEAAPGRPVLQCNRLDLRLSWLRSRFPDASILLLYRNPREQWLSVQRGGAPIPPSYRLHRDSAPDLFYTLEWAEDLRAELPFLDPAEHEHPYALHYLLWRISYLFGERYADLCIAYEDLVSDLEQTFGGVLRRFGVAADGLADGRYRSLLDAAVTERWRQYAPASWFEAIERDCERELAAFFAASSPETNGSAPATTGRPPASRSE